jgi:uncharacterized membrane protein YciS (DUF1049 family)
MTSVLRSTLLALGARVTPNRLLENVAFRKELSALVAMLEGFLGGLIAAIVTALLWLTLVRLLIKSGTTTF